MGEILINKYKWAGLFCCLDNVYPKYYWSLLERYCSFFSFLFFFQLFFKKTGTFAYWYSLETVKAIISSNIIPLKIKQTYQPDIGCCLNEQRKD